MLARHSCSVSTSPSWLLGGGHPPRSRWHLQWLLSGDMQGLGTWSHCPLGHASLADTNTWLLFYWLKHFKVKKKKNHTTPVSNVRQCFLQQY